MDAVDIPEALRRKWLFGVRKIFVVGFEEAPIQVEPALRAKGRRCQRGRGLGI